MAAQTLMRSPWTPGQGWGDEVEVSESEVWGVACLDWAQPAVDDELEQENWLGFAASPL